MENEELIKRIEKLERRVSNHQIMIETLGRTIIGESKFKRGDEVLINGLIYVVSDIKFKFDAETLNNTFGYGVFICIKNAQQFNEWWSEEALLPYKREKNETDSLPT